MTGPCYIPSIQIRRESIVSVCSVASGFYPSWTNHYFRLKTTFKFNLNFAKLMQNVNGTKHANPTPLICLYARRNITTHRATYLVNFMSHEPLSKPEKTMNRTRQKQAKQLHIHAHATG